MGNLSSCTNSSQSSNSFTPKDIEIILHARALDNYKKRLRSYNYCFHGNYSEFLDEINAQFELECLPDYVLYGSTFHSNYSRWN